MARTSGDHSDRLRRTVLEAPQTIATPLVIIAMTLLLGGLALGLDTSGPVLALSVVLAAAAVAVHVPALRRQK
ncbi:hypothetical protein [uncultured Pseudokineococcus sp.]|uniref:hypothetical protein n=1 Tax=uncultured Pseudokineococcus sp. TaxID=1642928 RepID=UPI0026105266|nr:hypothetical protein [uncultured Pseudokineococcus sp.]